VAGVAREFMNTITRVMIEPNFELRLTYVDGAEVLVDFKPVIEVGGVFARLKDLDFFNQVKIGSRGRSIEWPDEIDFCADALRMDGQSAEAPLAQVSLR
jgi:hypothetical protein